MFSRKEPQNPVVSFSMVTSFQECVAMDLIFQMQDHPAYNWLCNTTVRATFRLTEKNKNYYQRHTLIIDIFIKCAIKISERKWTRLCLFGILTNVWSCDKS